jgi:hypothetical protein
MPPDSVMILLSFLPTATDPAALSRCGRIAGLPNKPRLNETVAHTDSKASVVNSCGTRPIIERAAR